VKRTATDVGHRVVASGSLCKKGISVNGEVGDTGNRRDTTAMSLYLNKRSM